MKNTKNKNQFDFLKDKCIFYITGIANVKWVVIWLRMPTKDTFLFYFILIYFYLLAHLLPGKRPKKRKQGTKTIDYQELKTSSNGYKWGCSGRLQN